MPVFGLTLIKSAETFGNEVLWNQGWRDSNRRSNAARAAMHSGSAENPSAGAKVYSRQDYARMAEPIRLEIKYREQEILEFFSRELEQPVAS